MKKVATALVALMFLGSISFAQSTPAKTDAPKAKTEKTADGKKMDKKAAKEKKKMDKMDKKADTKTAPAK